MNSAEFSFWIEEIGKSYGKTLAVAKLSFNVEPGEIFGLLGPNGSGKSTTLHMLTGLLAPSTGTAVINGINVTDKGSRRWIGFAPDDLPLPATLTGHEYLNLHHRLRKRDDKETAADLAAALDIDGALDRTIMEYSHGMKRKLQLVAAVMHQPQLLVLDEPFRGLDPEASATLRELLDVFTANGGGVLVATHDMLRAERDCQRVLIINKGRLAALGTPKELKATYGAATLEDVFLLATEQHQHKNERRSRLSAALSAAGYEENPQ
jgi:ABC-2 type transport system ATP-binding protein